jgi:hypothetical protein
MDRYSLATFGTKRKKGSGPFFEQITALRRSRRRMKKGL